MLCILCWLALQQSCVTACCVWERDALYRLLTANSLGVGLARALNVRCGTAVIDTDPSVTKRVSVSLKWQLCQHKYKCTIKQYFVYSMLRVVYSMLCVVYNMLRVVSVWKATIGPKNFACCKQNIITHKCVCFFDDVAPFKFIYRNVCFFDDVAPFKFIYRNVTSFF